MANYSWVNTAATAKAVGANLTASTTATSLLPTPAVFTIPANALTLGTGIYIMVAGQLGNIVTTPGTLILDIFLGGSVVAFTTAAMQLSSTAHTALPFVAEFFLSVQAEGSGTNAKLMGQAVVMGQALSLTAVADSTTTVATLMGPNTTPTLGTGFDSTLAQSVNVRGTFSLSNANAIELTQYWLQIIN
jgi:hypothetical protein